LFFVVLMLIYPSICLRVTRFFKCDHIGHLHVLGSDLYTTCFDTEWTLMAVPAVVSVASPIYILYSCTPVLLYSCTPVLLYSFDRGVCIDPQFDGLSAWLKD
jgi:hypothetical protein